MLKRCQGRAGMTLLLMALSAQFAVPQIIRNHEPVFSRSIFAQSPINSPIMFPRTSTKNMMMLGMAKEDLEVRMTRIPPASLVASSLPSQAHDDISENIIEDMVTVMKMVGEDPARDPLMNGLLKVMKDANSTGQVNTRTGGVQGPQISKQVIDQVKEILAFSGVEAVLPLDCGRNPLNPIDPLGKSPLPWIAALGSRENGRFYYRCTGLVVSNFHILTDADCVTSPNINVVQLNISGLVPEPFPVENFVAGRRVHPKVMEREDLLSGYNIGLLELASPLQFNDFVQPICLPGLFENPDPDERSTSTVIGFDNIVDSEDGRSADLYTRMNSTTRGSAICYSLIRDFNQKYPQHETSLYKILTKKHICVIVRFDLVGKSVVVRQDPVTRRVKAIGVGAVANARWNNPVAYTLTQSHRFWIELVIKKFKDNTSERRS